MFNLYNLPRIHTIILYHNIKEALSTIPMKFFVWKISLEVKQLNIVRKTSVFFSDYVTVHVLVLNL